MSIVDDVLESMMARKFPSPCVSRVADLSFNRRYGMKQGMEKIDPQPDHERLKRLGPGQRIIFQGKPYTIQRRTALASGEAAVVLQGEREQFVISAAKFLAGVE
jgi:hypothetical protein